MGIAKSGGIDLILGSLAPGGGGPKYIYVVVQTIPDVALGCYLSGGQPVIYLEWILSSSPLQLVPKHD